MLKSTSDTHGPHLLEIDGLRGFAVSIVLLFHLGVALPGGAIGVDIFFTISGFVITRALLQEARDTGRVSLRDFAARRIRRLLPAATVVAAATLAITAALWFRPRFLQTTLDALAASTAVENWHLIGSSASYLHDPAPSPLQHYWSLAVEEQFYLVWPLVVLLSAAARGPRARQFLLASSTIVIAVSSVGLAAHLASPASDAAYFHTGARLWEIMAGCLCAQVASAAARAPRPLPSLAATSGALLVIVTPFILPTSSLPWPGAAPAIVGTALVLLFAPGACGAASLPWLLKPLRWLGLRSYSIYLWHFPLIVITSSMIGEEGVRADPVVASALATTTIVLAAVTYRFIEDPIRRRGRRRPPAPQAVRMPPRANTSSVFVLSGITILVMICLAGAQLRAPTRLADPAFLAFGLGMVRSTPTSSNGVTLPALHRELDAATQASSWPPEIRRELESAFTSRLPPAMDTLTGCRYAPGLAARGDQPCSWGDDDAEHRAVLIGDSTAAAWSTGVVGALVPLGWRVDVLSFSGCSPVDVTATPPGDLTFPVRCAASRKAMIDLVESAGAELVILSGGTNLLPHLDSGARGDTAESEWGHGTLVTLRLLEAEGRRIVTLQPPPPGASPGTCPTRQSTPSDCSEGLSDDYHLKKRAEADATILAREEGINARFIDTQGWFCSGTVCPLYSGHQLIRADRSHLTERMSGHLSTILREALVGQRGPNKS